MPERDAALRPQRVVRDAEHHERVGRAEDLVRHDRGVGVAAAGRAPPGAEVDPRLIGQERPHDVEHGDLDLLATAGAGGGPPRPGAPPRPRPAPPPGPPPATPPP